MTDIVIRQVQGEEMFAIARQFEGYAFHPSPPLPSLAEVKQWSNYFEDGVHVALFEDGKPAAYAVCSPLLQNVRGTLYRCGGLLDVSTHPMARRKGYARQLLCHLFAAMYEAGVPFSTLYAFRESFYTRLGYTTFPQAHIIHFDPSSLVPLLKKDLAGHVELQEATQNFAAHRAFLGQQQRKIHGMALFPHKAYHNQYWLATALLHDEIAGLMLYQVKDASNGLQMQVYKFHYDNSQAKYLLLEWFARHADQIKDVELKLPPYELPETWFPDMNITIGSAHAPMARIIDLQKMAGMQSGPGQFSAYVNDVQCPWNSGSYRFETVDGLLHISQSSKTDCHLSIQALSALVYGTHDPETFALREWGNPTPEIQASMRSMFPSALPYLYETF